MQLENKKVAIFGLGKSGLDLASLLLSYNANVKITEIKDSPDIKKIVAKLDAKIKVEIGKHTYEFIQDCDLIVLSPGVRKDLSAILSAIEDGVPVIGEIELASSLCPAPVVAITGSNGKTTVTTLAAEVLKLTGRNVFLCGNIGRSFSSCIPLIKKDDIVCLEVSSFQLETIVNFKPKVAVFLNFNRNHLDRHKDMDEYFNAKKRIFANQDETDWAVLNHDEALLRDLAKDLKAKVVYFNLPAEKNKGFSNPNFLAVKKVGSIFGIKEEDCDKVFSNFKGLEHRLEFVDTIKGVEFVNDSKATTVDACLWALNNIDKPIIMIAGGRDKGGDFSLIRDLAFKKIKELILIGEAKGKIRSALNGLLNIKEAGTLKEAVHRAFGDSKSGDCILLCPMCTSFDMFSNFEERGNIFKNIVRELINA